MIYGFVEEQSPKVQALAIVAAPVTSVRRAAPSTSVERPLPVLRLVAIVAAIFLFGAAKPLIDALKAVPATTIAVTVVR